MSWNNYAVWCGASLFALFGSNGVAFAQQANTANAANANEGALAEIVVTAEKRSEKIQDVPIAVTVVTGQQLADQHIYSIADLARTTPALEMVQAFGGPGGGGQIRGIGTNSFSPTAEGAVGIVVDGVPQGNVNITNLFDLQRVEVLKGPQGTLFGLTSSAGVINMVTAAPDPTKYMVSAHVDYSDDGRFGSNFGEETERVVLNAPLSSNAAIRLAISDDRIKGVQVNNFTGTPNVSTEWGGRLRFLYQPTDELEINLSADYDRRGQNYSDPQFNYVSANPMLTAELAACGITPSYSNQARCWSNANDTNYRNYGASAQFDYHLGFATLTSITGYRKQITAPSDFDAQGLSSDIPQIFNTGESAGANQFSQELRIASTGQQTIDYVAGLFYSNYSADTAYVGNGSFNVGIFPAPGFFFPFVQTATSTNTTNKSEAVFGQMTYHLTDQLGLIGGIRYTHQSLSAFTSADRDANPALPPSLPQFGSLDENNVSGRVGVQYKIDPDLTSYFTVVRGYKGPQVTPAAEGTAASVVGAEIPTAFELGIKGSTLNHQLGWDSDIFYSRVHDYQGQACSLNPVGALVCIGQSVPQVITKGFELNAYGQVAPGLTITAGYIYDVAKYPNGYTGYDPNNLTPGGHTDLSNLQIVGVPKNKISLSALYDIPLSEAIHGFVNADTVYKSAMRLGPTADPRFVYPGNWNTGLRIGVKSPTDTWSAALFARNLGQDHEPVVLFGGPSFTPPGVVPFLPLGAVNGVSGWQTVNSLRQVGITLEAKF